MTDSSNPLDRFYHYALAKQTGGLSPRLWLAFMDWALHLSLAPGTRAKLASKLLSSGFAYQNYLASVTGIDGSATVSPVEPAPRDKRFSRPEWSQWPYNALAQGFLLFRAVLGRGHAECARREPRS